MTQIHPSDNLRVQVITRPPPKSQVARNDLPACPLDTDDHGVRYKALIAASALTGGYAITWSRCTNRFP